MSSKAESLLAVCLGGLLLVGLAVAPAPAAGINNGLFEGGWVNLPPSGPLDLAADAVPTGWTRFETFSGGAAETSAISVVRDNGPSAPGNWALQCNRAENPTGAGVMSGDWTVVDQALNVDASYYKTLNLQIDTKVFNHNLEAGGFVSPAFEWPVVLEIVYKTTGGGVQTWRYGWFIDPPGDSIFGPVNDPGQGLIPIYNDRLVQPGVWVTTSFNLLAQLPQLDTITRVRVGGSGWAFEGRADNLILTGQYIPEPATLLLVGAGLLGTALARRRR